jgi:hypothetical protein
MSQTWEAAQTRPRAGFFMGATPFLSRVASGALPEHVCPNPPSLPVAYSDNGFVPVALEQVATSGIGSTGDLAATQARYGKGGF